MSPIDLAWLAGWLEGEGCFYFTLTKSSPTAIIQVFSVDRDVIDKAAEIMGGRIYFIKPHGTSVQAGWRIHLESLPAIELMKKLLPLMGKRRTSAIELAIHRWDTRSNKPTHRLCACGCGRPIFGRPRIRYAQRETGACAMRAFRARQKLKEAA